MRKNKILTSLLGLVTVSSPLITLANCSCNTTQQTGGKVNWSGDNVENVTASTIELNKELVIIVLCKDGFSLDSVESLTVGDKTLTLDTDYTVDTIYSKVTIKASAMISTNVNIKIKTKSGTVADITSLYDEYLKTLDVYTVERASINYLFVSSLLSSLVGLTVAITNFKINAKEQPVPAGLISAPKIQNQYLRLDFNITKLFEIFSFEEDCTVTFDIHFKDDNTSLDKTISGYTLNIKADEPAPTEEYTLSLENGTLAETPVPEYKCSWEQYFWQVGLIGLFYDMPKLIEKINATSMIVNGISSTTEKNILLFFPQSLVNMPSCLKNFEFQEYELDSNYKIYFDFEATGYDEDGPYGFETITLQGDDANRATVYFLGCINNYQAGSLYCNVNLKTMVLAYNRPTVFTVYDEAGTTAGVSPFCGCANLSKFDLTSFSNASQLDNLTFTNGTDTNTIFNNNGLMKTHADEGEIVVKKDASNALKEAVRQKFTDAGLEINDVNWKIVEAEE